MSRHRLATTAALLGLLIVPALAQDKPKRAEERRAAAEELFERLDKNRDLALEGDEVPKPSWLERYDRNGDDKITKKEMLEIVDRGPGLDRLFLLRDIRARARNALAQFDQDQDGLVSLEEYPGDDKAFKKVDRNRDEQLEWKELTRLAERELDDIRKRMKSPGRYDFLNLFDINGDRKVTQREYDGPARSFRKYDENSDGTVDYYEIYPDRRPTEMEARRPEPEDLNVISTLDANDDGKVSREEWKGSAAAWKRLDRNNDGWITTADAR
jgi:Ca2+-binding EF-hand superfamily protein